MSIYNSTISDSELLCFVKQAMSINLHVLITKLKMLDFADPAPHVNMGGHN